MKPAGTPTVRPLRRVIPAAEINGVTLVNLQVKEMQDFRLALPADAKIVVCKNTLMKIAADKVEGWSDLKQASQVC